jgi:alkylhydroperoxidase/carboxymuconolactone decarboxylase family protein YurZ
MIQDYSKNYNDLIKLMEELNTKIPETIKGFNALHKASKAEGALTAKIKELMALSVAPLMGSGLVAVYGCEIMEALN